jgi:capsular polysaccharide biosynthesis protein
VETQNDLQDWQEEILRMNNPHETLELQPQQKSMIEKLLFPSDSNPYWVEAEYRKVLERVLMFGYYSEEDREALNYARECYLRGRNWIK